MVGLDAAGKTTILYKLKLGEIVTTIPTIGKYGSVFIFLLLKYQWYIYIFFLFYNLYCIYLFIIAYIIYI